jgi:hypothetical protein
MAGQPGTLENIALELTQVLKRLEDLLRPDTLLATLAEFGVAFPDQLLQNTALMASCSNTASSAAALSTLVQNLVSAIEAGDDGQIVAAGVALLEQIGKVITTFSALESQLQIAAATMPGVTAQQVNDLVNNFPARLLDFLIVHQLDAIPSVGAALTVAGLIDRQFHPADPTSPTVAAYEAVTVRYDRIGPLLSSPGNYLNTLYNWGSAGFTGEALLQTLNALVAQMGLPSRYIPPAGGTPAKLEAFAVDLQVDPTVSPPGIKASVVMPITLNAQRTIALPDPNWTLLLQGTATIDIGASGEIKPPLDVSISPPSGTLQGNAQATIRGRPASPFILIGQAGGSRLEVGSVDAGATLAFSWNSGTGSASLDPGFTGKLSNGKLVIDTSDSDGFISTILSGVHVESDFEVSLTWDVVNGLQFQGSSTLEIELPVHVSLGPIDLPNIYVAVTLGPSPIPIDFAVDINGNLGPLAAAVTEIGATVNLSFPTGGGNVGPAQIDFAFKPPTGVGLSVNAGVIQGGGFLYIDTARGEYAGALQLMFADFLGLQAIGLITTRMPDGSSGFSLLIIITVDFGAGIQLGFGFTLLAVGGLLGLNRSMLFQPLMDGIRTDSIESIMFPQDVIANAPRIISDLRAIFPPQQGTFLVGPMAKLGWGEPTLISLALGVIIEIPPGDIAILGILKLALPADDIAVLLLQVNFAGALEFDKQRLYFFASLFDSHILFITLEGEMGLLMAWGDNANFVVSIGGFHPQFNPPPLPFPSPKRIEVDIINESYARIRCDGYFAVTTNTVQFGTHSEYFFGFSALNLSGSSGFDALIQFSPFHFIADISTSFSVNVLGIGCYGIDMDLSLEGPTPWHAHGTASISFFFFSIGISVDFTWGDSRNTMLPPIAVMPVLSGEFEKQSNWKAVLPSGSNLLVTLRQLDPSESDMVLHPVGTLHVSQRAVPLDLTLDKDGNQQPSDANYFTLDVTSGGLAKTQTLQEPFAPAQFKNMDDAIKLSQPAFVPMDSGIELSAAGNAYASGTAITRNVRYDLTVIDTKLRRVFRRFYVYTGSLFAHFLNGSSVTRSVFSAQRAGQSQPYSDHVAVNPETFAVALQTNNKVYNAQSAAFSSQAAAQDYLSRAVAQDPTLAGTLHVLPQFEVAA